MRNLDKVAVLICSLIALASLVFIVSQGVNVPFSDEWWYSGLVRTLASGKATFNTFWVQNNEHRMAIPKLEFATLAILTGWNSKMMMFAGWIVMMGAFSFLFAQFRNILNGKNSASWLIGVTAAAAIFFSFVQYENWLWAYQFTFFFIQGCVVLGVFLLCDSRYGLGFRLLASCLLSALASISSAQGLLAWPALVGSFSLTQTSIRKRLAGILFLLIAATVIFSIYFYHLNRSPDLQLRSEQLMTKPQLPIIAFFGLIGNPLVFWVPYEHRPHRAWVVGFLLTLLFLGMLKLVARERKLATAAPWIGLGIFSLGFCAMTTYGRIGLGFTGGFLASRYTTHVTPLLVSMLALTLILTQRYPGMESRRLRTRKIFSTGFGCFILFLTILGDITAFQRTAIQKNERSFAKSILPFCLLFNPEVDGLKMGPYYPLCPLQNKSIIKIGIQPFCNQEHIRPITNCKFVDSLPGLYSTYSISRTMIPVRYLEIPDHGWLVTGKIFGASERLRDIVFIRKSGEDGFITAAPLVSRQEKGAPGKDWQVFLSDAMLPGGNAEFSLWLFDSSSNSFFKATPR
ncbi:MAG: hypothetical protein JO076_06775 [Verrucomicrobia bacterium]|nr:hypothetical protein [Verrucomicrobiota bacterium]